MICGRDAEMVMSESIATWIEMINTIGTGRMEKMYLFETDGEPEGRLNI